MANEHSAGLLLNFRKRYKTHIWQQYYTVKQEQNQSDSGSLVYH